jgi:hemerythrin-like domain-containing protein
MPRPDPLETMRQDHQRVLGEIGALERALGSPRGPAEGDPADLLALLDRQFGTHMRAEDELIFPALRLALPESVPTLAGLSADHRELHEMLAALRRLVEAPASPARDEQIVVQVRDLADLLRIHIRKEESLVFGIAEHVLPEAELHRLAARLESTDVPSPAEESGPRRKDIYPCDPGC